MPSRATPTRHVTFVDAYGHAYAGAQRSIHLFAQHLPEHGFTTDVVVTSEGPFVDQLVASGVETTVIPVGRALARYGGSTTGWRVAAAAVAMPRFWRALTRHVRARPGVVHACSQRSVLLAAPAARRAGASFLWQVAAIEEDRMVSRLCDLLAHRTIGITKAVRVPSLKPWRRQEVVPVPLDPRLADAPQAKPSYPPTVFTVGRLDPIKNVDVLLHAIALVRAEVPHVRLKVVGDEQAGYEQHAAYLYDLRDRLGLAEVVDFAGWVDDLVHYWQGASAYAQASRLEGQGVAVLEAMACGIPTIVTSSMGVAEFLTDGRTALVVPPGDAAALAVAIERLLDADGPADRIVEEARELALDRFSVDEICARLARIYDRLLS